MADITGITWCDSTFNPWMGCTKVSPACDHCYAERDTKRFGRVEWGAGMPRVRTSAKNWKGPADWNDAPFVECHVCGGRGEKRKLEGKPCFHWRADGSCAHDLYPVRRRVFCASLADWLDNEVPIEWLVDLLDLIRRTPNLDWLLLTKRIGNWRNRMEQAYDHLWSTVGNGDLCNWIANWSDREWPPPNVWLGSTVVNQAEADRDIPKLLRVPGRVRFLSIEPMLGPIEVGSIRVGGEGSLYRANALTGDGFDGRGLDWIICGGESGPNARPMHPDWVRSLRDQCEAASVPFMVKQLSSGGSKAITNLSDFPLDLRIQQFPEVSP